MRAVGRRERGAKAVRKEFRNVQNSFRSAVSPASGAVISTLPVSSSLSLSPCRGEGAGRRMAVRELGLPGPHGCVPGGERWMI